MTDPVTVIETVCTTVVAGGGITAVVWKRLGRTVAERRQDDLLLHGSPVVPGVRAALVPAGVRLQNLEKGIVDLRAVVDKHGEIMVDIQNSLRMDNGQTLSETVTALAKDARSTAATVKAAVRASPSRK